MIERTHAATHNLVTLDSKIDCIESHFEYELEKLETMCNKSRGGRIGGYTQERLGGAGGAVVVFVGCVTIE